MPPCECRGVGYCEQCEREAPVNPAIALAIKALDDEIARVLSIEEMLNKQWEELDRRKDEIDDKLTLRDEQLRQLGDAKEALKGINLSG